MISLLQAGPVDPDLQSVYDFQRSQTLTSKQLADEAMRKQLGMPSVLARPQNPFTKGLVKTGAPEQAWLTPSTSKQPSTNQPWL